MIRLIEELSFNAWPALRTLHYDGWVLRFANGFSKRANSVNPIYDSTIDLERKIDYCEAAYREMGLRVIFKLNEISHPENLDDALSDRGYEADSFVSVQVLELRDVADVSLENCGIDERVTDEWLDAYCGMDARAAANRATLRSMLEAIVPRTAFVALREDESTIACGMGVLDSGFVGLFNIIVDETHRGEGHGTRIISALSRWARENGAHSAYLQALKDNSPAIAIYKRLGFREISQYWYRIKE